MNEHIELNPVSHLTIGTTGKPGNRTFYIQGSKGSSVISLTIEKQQAAMLLNSFIELLDELPNDFPGRNEDSSQTIADMRLKEPIDSLFRVGNIGVGRNDDTGQIILVSYEVTLEEDENPNVVSFWANVNQIRRLIQHTTEVVQSGRPICGNCGEPINDEGHFCPKRNGHAH